MHVMDALLKDRSHSTVYSIHQLAFADSVTVTTTTRAHDDSGAKSITCSSINTRDADADNEHGEHSSFVLSHQHAARRLFSH